jgi:hypothetical protein
MYVRGSRKFENSRCANQGIPRCEAGIPEAPIQEFEMHPSRNSTSRDLQMRSRNSAIADRGIPDSRARSRHTPGGPTLARPRRQGPTPTSTAKLPLSCGHARLSASARPKLRAFVKKKPRRPPSEDRLPQRRERGVIVQPDLSGLIGSMRSSRWVAVKKSREGYAQKIDFRSDASGASSCSRTLSGPIGSMPSSR